MLWKEVGETPFAALSKWRKENPKYQDTPACYAGRLDPMAKGKLLILLGNECKKKDHYTGLDKEYEREVLFDVGTSHLKWRDWLPVKRNAEGTRYRIGLGR